MTAQASLRVEGLTRHFPVTLRRGWRTVRAVVKAVDDVSFEVPPGKTLALVGESGCGKTTTAKLILALDRPTGGSIHLGDTNVQQVTGEAYRRYREQVQAVFQDPWSSLNPRMRVREIVAEPLVVNGRRSRREIRARVGEVLEAVGLDPDHGDRFPHEFSGGQRQRIALASALASSPQLIVLDEPVSSLDVSIRAQTMNLFRDLQRQFGVSYLLIVHDLAVARYMSDEIAVMYLGKIVERAETETLFADPTHPYTQALFAAALPGHPDVTREEIVLEGEVPSPINPPAGCPFHPRCPQKVGEVCETHVPVLEPLKGSPHWVSCHLVGEAGAESERTEA